MATSTYAVTGTPVNVVAGSVCRRIKVQENYDAENPPTIDLKKYQPYGSTTPILIAQGTPAVYTPDGNGYFYKGQIVGQIATTSGSITVQQDEGDQI